MKRLLLICLMLLLAACQSTADPTRLPSTPLPMPVLNTSSNDLELDRRLSSLALEWSWDGTLAEDEYFDVRVWREGDPHYGISWTKDSRLDLTDWLHEQEPGTYFWSVALIEGRDGQMVSELVSEVEPQRFVVKQAIPELVEAFFTDIEPGFAVELYATGPQAPTTIIFGPDDRLYVMNQSGDLYVIDDDIAQPLYVDEEDVLKNAVGVAFYQDTIYITDGGRISTLTDSDRDGMLDTRTTIADGFPSWQYWGHSTNSLVLGPDEKLYFPVGATTDHGPLNSDEPFEGSIVRMNPDGSEIEIFADGFRNPYDLAFSPDGDLFANDNNPDQIDETLPFLPAEELNHIQEGHNYGFPDVFSPMPAPEGITPPVVTFLASVGSAGLTYYDAEAFPGDYQAGIFAAQWGSSGGTSSLGHGRRVVFIELEPDGNTFHGTWEDFLVFNPDQEVSSPVDVTVGPDGALYVAEYHSGYIFRVFYTGEIVDTVSTEVLGREIYRNGTDDVPSCLSCHSASGDGIGPSLVDIAVWGGLRMDGLSAPEYIKTSITVPDLYITPGYTAGVMYQQYGEYLTEAEIDAVIEYMLTR